MTQTKYPIRGIYSAEQEAFKLAFNSAITFEAQRPVVRFGSKAATIIRKASKLRRKDWASTSRWNEAADFTGLIGELAVLHYLGISSETAMADFLKGLSQGDKGHDLEAQGLKLDVKSTKGQALKFKFNAANRFSNLADGFVFCFVEEVASETWVHLLGWATRAEIKPFQREDGANRLFVRAETLRREGLLKPVNLLKETPCTLQAIQQ